MDDKKPTKQKTRHSAPSLDGPITDRIRTGLEQYALRYNPNAPPTGGDNQMVLPFNGVARALPGDMFPVDAFEVLRLFFPNASIQHMDGGLLTSPAGNLVLAQPAWIENDLGRVRVISVRAEHLDEKGYLDPIGRFGVLRELARLLVSEALGRDKTKSFNPTEITEQVQGGEFLDPAFFLDPLNRWAMHLGCPPPELAQLLRDTWGRVPITKTDILTRRPMLRTEEDFCDVVFCHGALQTRPPIGASN